MVLWVRIKLNIHELIFNANLDRFSNVTVAQTSQRRPICEALGSNFVHPETLSS